MSGHQEGGGAKQGCLLLAESLFLSQYWLRPGKSLLHGGIYMGEYTYAAALTGTPWLLSTLTKPQKYYGK